jgi:serine/threonine protein kinase|tara:strand:+ start:213 stop:842 length:630 start_codon:yes stop_codon:yes gene_type:complete
LHTRGRAYWIDKSSKTFYKIYKKDNLLDNPNSIKARLNQIVKLTDSMEFMPKTNYLYEEDLLKINQQQLNKQKDLKQINPIKRLSLVEQFTQSLDRMYEEGFIHGDINRKNIIYSDDRLCLIDFEPSLLQVKDRVKQWMSTRPYRYYEDIQNNNITVKSDFLGFGCFIKWFLLRSNPPQYYADECSKVIREFKIKSSPFQNLTRLLVIL